ncbi:MAG TPA: hypothetical protein VFN18_02505 [Solirubrobacterales bacterium]|nr:hypothetical protein [Solirubrobacterales bacterium]
MRRGLLALFSLALFALAASSAQAADEFDKYEIESASASLSSLQAGAHADFTTALRLSADAEGQAYANTRDVVVELPAGIFGNPEAFPKCSVVQLSTVVEKSECPQDSQVGSIDITISGTINGTFSEPVYNMPAPGGRFVARFGFFAGLYTVFINVRVDPETQALIAEARSTPAAVALIESVITFWGVPADPKHDPARITPVEARDGTGPPGGRPSTLPETPFMTNPTSCGQERRIEITATSYQEAQAPRTISAPFPQIAGCSALEFSPTTELKPTTGQGTSGSGLDYSLAMPTKGLEFGHLRYGSESKRAEVILPEGMSVNPSQAEGIGVCSQADLARETYDGPPDQGCPETSKIGSVIATTPVIDRDAVGSLYLAKPYENPFGSLIAVYMVLKVPDRGILVKLPGKVTTDPVTGRITTVFDDIPQLPVATFQLHFREGARAPLVTPPACGSYSALSNFSPWAAPGSLLTTSNAFDITSGPDHGPCPTGGLPPFRPSLLAGTVNNAAGTHSPFDVRITRSDAEQEITNFSIKLPPGIVGKLAGIPFCPDAAIAAATARTGVHGGEEELAAPSCPAASEVGHTLVGAGVGQVLVYVPGKVYLAGPYHGAPLSIVAVTAAKAGPFDLGTVVVRYALKINPETAEVFVDATGSDPIPHIIAGIPVRLREIRAYVDRPDFVLNPTSCAPTSTASTVLGSGLDFVSPADDNPFVATSPFQAADCASLGYEPKLSLRLRGSTKRGGNPALRAVLAPRPGDANSAAISVTLPHSEFLEQGHIRTICTRVQFNAGAGNGAHCPAGSIYGHAKAWTPILAEPLEGPIFLRSNGGERDLPDLVLALHGLIDFNAVGFIDSNNGGIRNSFDLVPDAPITKVVVDLQGGSKSLLANSRDLCKSENRATVKFKGQNGKTHDTRPLLKVKCKKGKRKHQGSRRHARAAR